MSLSKNRINLAPLAEEPQGNEGDIAIIAGRLKYFYNGQWIQYGGYGFPIGYIGSSPLVINENLNLQRYLNGQKIAIYQFLDFDQALVATANVYPNILKTETEWQAIAASSVGGQCGYFVRDEEEGTIRLPKIIMPIQGLTDLSKLGDIMKAGLPNIKDTIGKSNGYIVTGDVDPESNGTLSVERIRTGQNKVGTSAAFSFVNLSINASRSSDIYGNSDTVQQEQIQYPYFIQVATGVETQVDVTREIQLNNPYTLFDCKYSEAKLYNISWLLSSGQWNNKAVYPTAYDALLVEYNAEITEGTTVELPSGTSYTKRGLSVKLSTEEYTDYDFVLNTTDETFRLAIKAKYILPSDNSVAVKGNGKTIGIYGKRDNTSEFANAGLAGYVGDGTLKGWVGLYGSNAGDSTSDNRVLTNAVGLTSDPTKSGIVGNFNEASLYLYYYMGETVQDANLINAGRIEETKANVDMNNLSTAGRAEVAYLSSPSDEYITFNTPTTNTTQTAPADGWFLLGGTSSANASRVALIVQKPDGTFLYNQVSTIYEAGKAASVFLRIRKGNVCRVLIENMLVETVSFKFFYAQGEI